jgi:hypothetical protein
MENRKVHRAVFERGFAANMMAIDGTSDQIGVYFLRPDDKKKS